jgi:hypothetical protein
MNTSIAIQPLAQFWGIVRYEMLLQWRQRYWIVIVLPLCLAIVLGAFGTQNGSSFSRTVAVLPLNWETDPDLCLTGQCTSYTQIELVTATPAQLDFIHRQRVALSGLVAPLIFTAIHLIILFLFTMLLADVIPKDRKYGIGELFGVLPLPNGVYLAGKTAASMLSTLLIMGIVGVFYGIVWWVIVYPFEVGNFVLTYGLGLLVTSTLTAGLSVLIFSGQPSRRRAIIFSFGWVIVLYVLMAVPFSQIGIVEYLNPSRPFSLGYYVGGVMRAVQPPNASPSVRINLTIHHGHLLLAGIIGLLEIVGLWAIVRTLWNRQETR